MMPALVLTGPATLRWQHVPVPVPTDGEALVHVHLVGVCGSEVHDSKHPRYRRPPLVMGHEIVGRVEGREGRVAVDPLIACQTCAACRTGRTNLCAHRTVVGIHRPGGFAPKLNVPDTQLLTIPPGTNDAQAVMAEPLANGLHAWARSGCRPTDRVAVLGAGPIGLAVATAARAHDAANVVVVDPSPVRRRAAAAAGLTASQVAPPGRDVVFDCVGSAAAHHTSLEALSAGGTAVWLGLAEEDPAFDGTDLVRDEKSVRGCYGYTRQEFEQALTLAAQLPDCWIEERPLVQGPAVFEDLWQGRLGVPKIALRAGVRGRVGP